MGDSMVRVGTAAAGRLHPLGDIFMGLGPQYKDQKQ